MDLMIAGKRALVLGASAGLGRAVAQALVQEGVRVAIVSRDAGRIEAARAAIGAECAFALDVEAPGAGRSAVDAATRLLGGIDIVVCNTGGPPKAQFADVTLDAWQHGFQGLFLGAVETMQAVLPGMRAQKWGRILLITSVAAKEPMPALTVSNALRAGLLGLTKSLSDEVACDGVTVNALLPGYTRTSRMEQLGVTDAQIAGQVPARRMGEPQEFAALAAFLASQPAAYITGQAIACDGGWLRSM
jgi:3-oxoacyl-[acyl-carrier protein] reductase